MYIDMWCVLRSGTFPNLTKNNALPQVILTFFNEANEIKSENASHIWINILNQPVSLLKNSCFERNCDEDSSKL